MGGVKSKALILKERLRGQDGTGLMMRCVTTVESGMLDGLNTGVVTLHVLLRHARYARRVVRQGIIRFKSYVL